MPCTNEKAFARARNSALGNPDQRLYWSDDRHDYNEVFTDGSLKDALLTLGRGAICVDLGTGSSRAALAMRDSMVGLTILATNLVEDYRHALFLGSRNVTIGAAEDFGDMFQRNELTLVTAVRSISYVGNHDARRMVAKSLRRCLAPGGLLVSSFKGHGDFTPGSGKAFPNEITAKEFETSLLGEGFEILRLKSEPLKSILIARKR